MQIEIKIDPAFTEPKLTLLTDRVTPEIEELLKRLSAPAQPLLAGFRDGGAALIDSARIFRIYAAAGKVFAVTDAGNIRCGSGSTSWRTGWTDRASCAFRIRRSSTSGRP